MLNRTLAAALILGASTVAFTGCQTTPNTDTKRKALHTDAKSVLTNMTNEDSTLQSFLDRSYGYVIFPSVGKGGLIVGGSYGRGEVYQGGTMIGYADISQATVGLQAGGQTFSELIVFENNSSLDKFKMNQMSFEANASAVAMKAGAGSTARFEHGVAVFTKPVGGLMFEASVGGQKFTYMAKM